MAVGRRGNLLDVRPLIVQGERYQVMRARDRRSRVESFLVLRCLNNGVGGETEGAYYKIPSEKEHLCMGGQKLPQLLVWQQPTSNGSNYARPSPAWLLCPRGARSPFVRGVNPSDASLDRRARWVLASSERIHHLLGYLLLVLFRVNILRKFY